MSSNGASTLGMPDSLPKQGTMSDLAGTTLEPRTVASPGPWRPSSIARSSSPALVGDNKPWASPSKKALGVSSSISSSSTSSSTFGNNMLHNSSYQNNNRSSTPMGEDFHHNQGSGSSFSKSASPVLTSGSFTRTQGGPIDSSSSPHSSAPQAQPQPLNLEALAAKFADSRETKEKFATLQLSPALTPSTFQEKDRRPAPMGSFSTPATHIKVQRTASLHYTPNNMNHSPKCKLLFISISLSLARSLVVILSRSLCSGVVTETLLSIENAFQRLWVYRASFRRDTWLLSQAICAALPVTTAPSLPLSVAPWDPATTLRILAPTIIATFSPRAILVRSRKA